MSRQFLQYQGVLFLRGRIHVKMMLQKGQAIRKHCDSDELDNELFAMVKWYIAIVELSP